MPEHTQGTSQAGRKRTGQGGSASQHLGPFPNRLQGEENKEWGERPSLWNSLGSLLKIPFPA